MRREDVWPDEQSMEHKINVERQNKRRRNFPSRARVTHPAHGEIIVPCASPLAAVMCAAEAWGCDWAEILDSEVTKI